MKLESAFLVSVALCMRTAADVVELKLRILKTADVRMNLPSHDY